MVNNFVFLDLKYSSIIFGKKVPMGPQDLLSSLSLTQMWLSLPLKRNFFSSINTSRIKKLRISFVSESKERGEEVFIAILTK